MRPRVVYMGTPDFAVPALEALAESDMCDVSLVVTQPDRRAGRGKKLVSPAVKIASERLGLPVVQTSTLRDADVRQRIIDMEPDLVVVAAFGMILGKWILELPAHGCVNLHASLLPKFRGANPIASAILEGESETGVSLMRMDHGLDTGPIYDTSHIPILPDDTTESMTSKLADAARELLIENLPVLLAGSIDAHSQGPDASLTRMMTKNDGWIDFSRPANELDRQVRAMWSWPRAWTTGSNGERIQVHVASLEPEEQGSPGTVFHRHRRVLVSTGEGALVLERVQLPGGRPIEGDALVHHPAFAAGMILGTSGEPGEPEPLVVPVTS